MPIDNITLMRHTPPPEKPRRRPRWVSPLVFVVGLAVMLAVFRFARAAPGRAGMGAGFFIILTIAYAGLLFIRGWNEGGLLGAYYRCKHPLGTMLAGDEVFDGLAIAEAALAGIGGVLALALLAT